MAGEISYNAYRRNNYDEKEYYSMIGGYSGSGVLGNYLLKTGDTATGSYTFDTDTLFIDADNHAIGMGIGSDSPGSLLDMEGALTVRGISAPGLSSAGQGILYFDVTSNVFKISENGGTYKNIFGGYWTANENDIYNNNSGGVGIGINSPIGMLHLNGDAEFSGNDLVIQNSSNNCGLTIISDVSCYVYYKISSTIGAAIGIESNGNLRFWRNYSGWVESITLQNTSGNVGINNSDPAFTLDVDGTGYFTGEVLLEDNIGSDTFFSGFGGSGWRLDADSSGVNTLSVDNLYVRKAMNVYELIINQIRATNGSLWVSDSVKITNFELAPYYDDPPGSGTGYTVYIDTENFTYSSLPIHPGDFLRCQKWTGSGVKYYTAHIDAVNKTGPTYYDYFNMHIIDGAGIPEIGDVLVRIGHGYDTNRQGAIYLTASDTNAPYIDILDGVDGASFAGKTKVRLGHLAGITDADFGGTLSGYGLYASNAYLKGELIMVANSSKSGIPESYNFQSSSDGWQIAYGTKTENTNTITIESTYTTNPVALFRHNLYFPGKSLHILQVRIKRITDGSNWVGKCYYKTSGHDYTDSYYKSFNESDITTEWGSLCLDMSELTAGGTDFIDNTILSLYFFFGYDDGGGVPDKYEIDQIVIGDGTNWGAVKGIPSMLEPPTGTGLFLSATHMGYYTASAWKTYMDNAGNMVLGDYAGGNAGLYWDQSGAALNIRGIIRATSGDIGGWTINSAYLAKDTGTDATSAGMAPTDYPFYGGATYANRATAPFRVTNAGVLTASDALITGTLQTGASGKRAVLSGVDNNMLFYGTDGSLITIDDSLLTDDTHWEAEPGIKIEGTSYFSYPSCLVSSMVFEMLNYTYSHQFYVKTNDTYLEIYAKDMYHYTGGNGNVKNLCIDTVTGRIMCNFS